MVKLKHVKKSYVNIFACENFTNLQYKYNTASHQCAVIQTYTYCTQQMHSQSTESGFHLGGGGGQGGAFAPLWKAIAPLVN